MVIWECALKGKTQKLQFPNTVDNVCNWLLRSNSVIQELSGALYGTKSQSRDSEQSHSDVRGQGRYASVYEDSCKEQ